MAKKTKKQAKKAIQKVKESSEQSLSSSHSQSESEEASSSQQKPKEIAVKNIQFRKRRGQKMKYLIDRKKQQEESEDDFWKNNKYFGQEQQLDKDDEEDYVQSSSGKDQFDSDFLSSQKESEEPEEEEEESQKPKRKAQAEVIEPKPHKKPKKLEPQKQNTFKYIHEEYTQEQLLAEAAHTQYFNLISLKKLISLEEEKKNYSKKQHTLDPPKIVYRDSLRDGQHIQTITLVGYPANANLFELDPL